MNKPTRFWDSFTGMAEVWARLLVSGQTQLVFEQLEAAFKESAFDFCFDLTMDENNVCCLILSPEGDALVAKDIDQLVAAAPVVPGWRIYSRRQRKTQEDAYAIIRHLYNVDVSEAKCKILLGDAELIVEFYLPASTDLSPEEGQGLVNTLLWHLLGEENVMVKGIKGRLLLGIPPKSNGMLSISELVTRLA